MDHLTANRLVDYVRGILTGQERAETEQHLAACGECNESASFLRKVRDSAQNVDVPHELVKAAKALFTPPGQHWTGSLRHVIAQMVPPAPGAPAWAEVRSAGQPAAQHFMYRWNDYCMDLRLEKEPESASVALLGQIANERTPDKPVGGVPVTLTAGDRVIAETRCNGLGEFCVEVMPVAGMRVRFDVEEAEVSIDVPLNKLKI